MHYLIARFVNWLFWAGTLFAEPPLNAAAAIGVELEKVRDSVYPL
jgi:hypothetical protein